MAIDDMAAPARTQAPSPTQTMSQHNPTTTKMKPGSTKARGAVDFGGEEWSVSSEGSWYVIEGGGGARLVVKLISQSRMVVVVLMVFVPLMKWMTLVKR